MQHSQRRPDDRPRPDRQLQVQALRCEPRRRTQCDWITHRASRTHRNPAVSPSRCLTQLTTQTSHTRLNCLKHGGSTTRAAVAATFNSLCKPIRQSLDTSTAMDLRVPQTLVCTSLKAPHTAKASRRSVPAPLSTSTAPLTRVPSQESSLRKLSRSRRSPRAAHPQRSRYSKLFRRWRTSPARTRRACSPWRIGTRRICAQLATLTSKCP